jgi:hypothetical protein
MSAEPHLDKQEQAADRMFSRLTQEGFSRHFAQRFVDSFSPDHAMDVMMSMLEVSAKRSRELGHDEYELMYRRLTETKELPHDVLPSIWKAVARFDCADRADVEKHTSQSLSIARFEAAWPMMQAALASSTAVASVQDPVPRQELEPSRAFLARIARGLYVDCLCSKPVQRLALENPEAGDWKSAPPFEASLETAGGLSFQLRIGFDSRLGEREDWVFESESVVNVEADIEGVYIDVEAVATTARVERLADEVRESFLRLHTILNGWMEVPEPELSSETESVSSFEAPGPVRPAVWRWALQVVFPSRGTSRPPVLNSLRTAFDLESLAASATHQSVRLMLAVAAVESLVTTGGSIGDRFENRVAVLLASDPRERPRWSEFARKIYDDRSRFVHGDSSPLTRERADDALLLMRECIRSYLFRVQFANALRGVESDLSKERIVQDLDTDMRGGQMTDTGFSVRRALRRTAKIDVL